MQPNTPRHEIDRSGSPESSIAHLRGLLEVTRLLRGEHKLSSVLDAIARTVCESLGFATVVITLYRPAWNDFEVTAVHGSEEARGVLMGTVREWEDIAPLIHERFLRRGAYFIPHNEFDWNSIDGASFVPDWAPSSEPDAWHPEDALLVPLRRGDGSTLGLISVDEPASGRTPSDAELDVLVAVAAHAALAVESTQEAERAGHYRQSLEQLLLVSSRLTESRSIDSILESVCDGIREALRFEKVSIDLLDRTDGRFHVRAASGWDMAGVTLPPPVSIQSIKPLLDSQFEVEGCFLVTPEEARARVNTHEPTYSSVSNGRGPNAWNHHWLLVPLYDRDREVIALIWVDDPEDRLIPSRDSLKALRMFANQATTALDSMAQFEEMRFLADHDPLTRLGNRRSFMARLELETSRALRYGTSFALVVCDLDGFKDVNDRHGHLAGDQALEHVAAVLRDALRSSDGAYRLGGDEFGLILVEAGNEIAGDVVDRVSSALAFQQDERLSGLRASFGVAVCPADGVTPSALFNAADQAMYGAKRSGGEADLPV
ncbi:MAG TPA: sensor domain-containing diguanylate cyclase [Thermoleophilaceae bacterium]